MCVGGGGGGVVVGVRLSLLIYARVVKWVLFTITFIFFFVLSVDILKE